MIDLLKEIRMMQTVYEKGYKLKSMPFHDKQAEATVLFLAPTLNQEGVYKMIFPALALNMYSLTHKAYVWGMNRFIKDKHVNDYDIELPDTLIAESNIIVLPFLTYDIKPLIKEIRSINPDIVIMYCVDFNFDMVPVGFPFYKQYQSNEQKNIILENIRSCDKYLTTSAALISYIDTKFGAELEGSGVAYTAIPIGFFPELIGQLEFDELPEVDPNQIARIGIIGSEHHSEDINCIRTQLKQLKDKHGKELEIISFGFDGKTKQPGKKGLRNVYHGIDITFEFPDKFYNYHQKLVNLQLDAVLIPVNQKSDFYWTSKNYSKFVECASLGIPIIATNIMPFKKIIQPGKSGILVDKKEHWVTEIDLIIEDYKLERDPGLPNKLDAISETAYNTVNNNYQYKRFVGYLQDIFNMR